MNGDKTPQEVLADFAATEAAAKQANATPLPGALAQAFSPVQDVKVDTAKGTLSLRPFYDSDFKLLQFLDHPLYKRAAGNLAEEKPLDDYRGEPAWVLGWLLTQPPKEARKKAKEGKEAVLEAAEDAFGEYQLGDQLKIAKAAFEQVGQYFSTVVAFEEAVAEGKEPSKKN